ncbi:hypothetical protein K7472_01690 [Streptomyces sp. PTM05]|uniref:FUSC family protein n=1 Tax=Streptantibioticus parmotrematis TaxID=2873249 RepID=A0ABS7QK67_9ACTN|nr:hypothetical protein [Streptantibioticus parmotrematis]
MRRAVRVPGHERHTVLLVGKSVVAAALAWFVAHDVLHARSPAFAPFSAVLIMNVTLYESLRQAALYVGAVAIGVAVQAGIGFVAGPRLLAFVLLAAITLVIERWPVLRSQRAQVSTAAFFAFATYVTTSGSEQRAAQLGWIVVLVLLGCALGVAINLFVAPPLRYRSAEYAIQSLAAAVDGLLRELVPALREGRLDGQETQRLAELALRAEGLIAQARSAVETAQQSVWLNPRRFLPRHRARTSFDRYRSVINALERVTYQLSSLVRALRQWEEPESLPYRNLLNRYADFLDDVDGMMRVLAEIDEDALAAQSSRLVDLADRAGAERRRVAEQADADHLPLSDPDRPYGILVVEASRIMEELRNTCDALLAAARADNN